MIAESRTSILAVAIAALLHAGVITALMTTGFDRPPPPTEPEPLVVVLIPERQPPPPPPLAQAVAQAPARATPPTPAIRVARPTPAASPPTLVASANPLDSVAPAAPVAGPEPVAGPSEPTHVAAVIDAGRSCRTPPYPPAARRNHQTGIVVLKFLIDEEGGVVDSLVANSSGFDSLDQAARDALALCRFRPGTVDGKPERSWVAMRYLWQLN